MSAPDDDRSVTRMIAVLLSEAHPLTRRATFTNEQLARAMGLDPSRSWASSHGWFSRAKDKLRAMGWTIELCPGNTHARGRTGTVYIAPEAWLGKGTVRCSGAFARARANTPARAQIVFEPKTTNPLDITQEDSRVTRNVRFCNRRSDLDADSVPEVDAAGAKNRPSQHNLSSRTLRFSAGIDDTFSTNALWDNGEPAREEPREIDDRRASDTNDDAGVIRYPNKPAFASARNPLRALDASPPLVPPPVIQERKRKRKRGKLIEEIEAAKATGDVSRFLARIDSSRVTDRTVLIAVRHARACAGIRDHLALAGSLVTDLRKRGQLANVLALHRSRVVASHFQWGARFAATPAHHITDQDREQHAKLARRYRLFTKGGADAQ